MRLLSAFMALAAAALPASAQSLRDQKPPGIELRKAWNAKGERSLGDFEGRAVLVEFFATW